MAPSLPTPTLFKNATIIAYDLSSKSLKTLHHASMLVENSRITQLSSDDLSNIPQNAETIDATDKIISPGFIDTHHHMWQTAFRTIAADTTLSEYFMRYSPMGGAHEQFTPDDMYLGQLASALELIDCGTTTVLDHAHGTFSDEHVDAVVNADFDSSLRVIHAHWVQYMEGNGYSYEKALAKFKALLADPRFAEDTNLVELGLAFDGFAFVPPELSMELMNVVVQHNNSSKPPISCLTSHFAGGPYGAENSPTCLHTLPTSVISQPTLNNKLPVILSHASFLSPKDAALVRANPHVTISTTPESEAHYGLTSYGADMCQDCASLGVDTHLTFSSYMPFQARLWLQLQRSKWFSQTAVQNGEVPADNPMKVEDAFLLATQKGGEALGRSDLGVLRVGAQADIVLFDTGRPGMWGVRDPVSAIVLHSCAGDVEGVMVQGRWVKRDGRVVSPLLGGNGSVQVRDVQRRFEESARRIQGVWEGREKPVFTAGEDTLFRLAKFGSCRKVEVRRQN